MDIFRLRRISRTFYGQQFNPPQVCGSLHRPMLLIKRFLQMYFRQPVYPELHDATWEAAIKKAK